MPCFPDDFPDTAAGEREQEKREKEMVGEYCHHLPDKHPNFGICQFRAHFLLTGLSWSMAERD